MGGLISAYIGIVHPEYFSRLMIFSPSFWYSDKIYFDAFNYNYTLPMRMYIYGGDRESEYMSRHIHRFKDAVKQGEYDESLVQYNVVINPDGEQVGIVPIADALTAAGDFGLDLVEISPNASPPVCKIMDYGRYKYEQTKKQQEAKKKQSTFQVKEIKIRPKTGEHDLNTKLNHIKRFIDKKDKVKVTVIFRGREITLSNRGRELLQFIAESAEEFASVEQAPKFEGRVMTMVLAPK